MRLLAAAELDAPTVPAALDALGVLFFKAALGREDGLLVAGRCVLVPADACVDLGDVEAGALWVGRPVATPLRAIDWWCSPCGARHPGSFERCPRGLDKVRPAGVISEWEERCAPNPTPPFDAPPAMPQPVHDLSNLELRQ